MQVSLEDIKNTLVNTELPIYISFHKEPDGDSIGSAIALYRVLLARGKDVFILNIDDIPQQFNFLISRVSFRENIEEKGIFIFLDFSKMNKMQNLKIDLKNDAEEIFFIDHRKSNLEDLTVPHKEYTKAEASSTAEIIYELIDILNLDIDKATAEALYTGIISDTRSFKYSRTTVKSLQIAADLMKLGIDNEQIHRRVFSASSLGELKVLGSCLVDSQLSKSGKVAWTIIKKDTMDKNNIKRAETKGFVNQLLSVNNVEIAVLFREDAVDKIKVSIRAKGRYGLKYLVSKYNGNSTPFSASFVYTKGLEEGFIKETVDKLDRLTSL